MPQGSARPHQAHTLRASGELLLARDQRGDRARAQHLLADATALYDRLGMTHFADKTRTRLATRGLATAAATAVFPGGLSEREVEVLRLVAAGKSNREIAETLVVSQNTVAFHIKSIFNKTGANNRTEAAAFAHRHQLADTPV